MSVERTLSIVKPDAVAQNHIGAILSMLEGAGLERVDYLNLTAGVVALHRGFRF